MIQKLMMQLGRTMDWLLAVTVILCSLCLVFGLFCADMEDRIVFLSLGHGGLAFVIIIFSAFKLKNWSKYNKLRNKIGEYGIQKLENEYQKGERTREAVFGDVHLFIESKYNILGFDMIEYHQILWMHLYEYITKYSFIPFLRTWSIKIYLDAPARGRQQIVEVNARGFHKEPKVFFDKVIARNPSILLGNKPDWERMYNKDKKAFIRFLHSQQQVLK